MITDNIIQILFVVNLLAFINQTIIYPFIPPQGLSIGLNNATVAFINNISQVAAGLVSQQSGILTQYLNRISFVYLGTSMQIIGMFLCAQLQFVHNKHYFSFIYLVVRILQGSGDALIMVGTYSILASKFSGPYFQKGLTIINSSIALGIALGPTFGSLIVLVGSGKYYQGLISFGMIQAQTIVIIYQQQLNDDSTSYKKSQGGNLNDLVQKLNDSIFCMEPIRLNLNNSIDQKMKINRSIQKNDLKDYDYDKTKINQSFNQFSIQFPKNQMILTRNDIKEISNDPINCKIIDYRYLDSKNEIYILKNHEQQKLNLKLSYSFIIQHEFAVLSLISGFLSIGLVQFPGPILANILKENFKSSILTIGIYQSLINWTEILGSLLQIQFKFDQQYYQMILGQFLLFLGMIMMGQPWCIVFEIPQSLHMVGIGLCLLGLGMIQGFVSVVPAIIEQLNIEQKFDPESQGKLSDLTSALFGVVFQIAGFIFPFIGGVLVDKVGFYNSCSILSALPLLQLFIIQFRCKRMQIKKQNI